MRTIIRGGFSLVELLVVVTIIVVLLALLSPALDQAIYQAELARCSVQVRGIASGAVHYTIDHKRFYPQPLSGRATVGTTGGVQGNPAQHQIEQLGERSAPEHFLLPVIQDHIREQLLLCPLASFKLSFAAADNAPETRLFANYSLWFGMKYNQAGNTGMFKLGDRFSHKEGGANGRLRRFSLLASDLNALNPNQEAIGTHPDRAGVLPPWGGQNIENGSPALDSAPRVTIARWHRRNVLRGLMDFNVAYDDLSVERIANSPILDPRLEAVPQHTSGSPWELQIPHR